VHHKGIDNCLGFRNRKKLDCFLDGLQIIEFFKELACRKGFAKLFAFPETFSELQGSLAHCLAPGSDLKKLVCRKGIAGSFDFEKTAVVGLIFCTFEAL